MTTRRKPHRPATARPTPVWKVANGTELTRPGELWNVAQIRERTAMFNLYLASEPVPVKPAPEPTEQERKLQALADHVNTCEFGCQQYNVRKLVAMLAGVEELPAPTSAAPATDGEAVDFLLGALIAATERNGNEPVLVKGIDSDGDAIVLNARGHGGSFVSRSPSSHGLRPVTDEEVTEFLREAGLPTE
jgi:hypothetical protein